MALRPGVSELPPPTSELRPRPVRAVGDDAKAERREAILDAAKATFAAKGYHATKISDVARAAGISYGSIYWYFDSKDALFEALVDHQVELLRLHIARTAGTISDREGAEDVFRSSVRATFEFFEADRPVAKLLFQDSLVRGPHVDRHLMGIFEGFTRDIEATVATGQAVGYLIPAPPRVVAFSVAALVSQLAVRRLTTDDGLTADELADVVVTLLLDGLRPRPTHP
jgi:AcrR family transcriptional regulator